MGTGSRQADGDSTVLGMGRYQSTALWGACGARGKCRRRRCRGWGPEAPSLTMTPPRPAGGSLGKHRMKVLVTGGAGFIGSHLAEGILAAGHRLVIVDNESTGERKNVPN